MWTTTTMVASQTWWSSWKHFTKMRATQVSSPGPLVCIVYHILSSRADFWALAGIAAVEKGIENANEDCDSDDCVVPDAGLSFQWGREVSDNIIYSPSIPLQFHILLVEGL